MARHFDCSPWSTANLCYPNSFLLLLVFIYLGLQVVCRSGFDSHSVVSYLGIAFTAQLSTPCMVLFKDCSKYCCLCGEHKRCYLCSNSKLFPSYSHGLVLKSPDVLMQDSADAAAYFHS
jgi:hypothetical protein